MQTQSKNDFEDRYINHRWKQLQALASESESSAIRYLFITNAGGCVALLTFIGTRKNVDELNTAILISLCIFLLGVIFIGFYHRYRVHFDVALFDNWRREVKKYHIQKISWEDLNVSDERKVKKDYMAYLWGNLSFICFILGCLVSGSNFFL